MHSKMDNEYSYIRVRHIYRGIYRIVVADQCHAARDRYIAIVALHGVKELI